MKKQEQVYVCEQCVHYVQHYIMMDGNYIRCCLGHCIYPRLKCRRCYAKACRHFEQCQKPL